MYRKSVMVPLANCLTSGIYWRYDWREMNAGKITSTEYNNRGVYYKQIIYSSEKEMQMANEEKLNN